MNKNAKKSKGLWKFFFWPVVWFIVFWAAYLPKAKCINADSLGIWSTIIGIFILLWAFAIHIVAGKTLKKKGHTPGHKSIWPNRMVTIGIYSCMRHPQHLGLAMIPLGIAFLLRSMAAVLVAGWAVLAAFFFVIVIEEPECIEKFGEEYFRYVQNTPAFSLRLQCLVKGLREFKKEK